jgi:hypothetical protein
MFYTAVYTLFGLTGGLRGRKNGLFLGTNVAPNANADGEAPQYFILLRDNATARNTVVAKEGSRDKTIKAIKTAVQYSMRSGSIPFQPFAIVNARNSKMTSYCHGD